MTNAHAYFNGRVAVVTGAASGIGRELALLLAAAGAHVVVADRNEASVRELAGAISAYGDVAAAVVADVGCYDEVVALIDDAERTLGPVDFLFNNAGICVLADMRDLGVDEWRSLVDTNLNGVMHGVLAVYRRMADRGRGHIVNVASLAGLIPVPMMAAYAATKHAVVGLSLSLRAEAEGLGVRVSAACPGTVDTPLRRSMAVLTPDLELIRERDGPVLNAVACARRILEGTARNDALIVIPPRHRVFSALAGVAPRFYVSAAARRVERSAVMTVRDAIRSTLFDLLHAGTVDPNVFYAEHERDDIFFPPEGLLGFGYWTPDTRSKGEADANFCRLVAERAGLGPTDRVFDAGCGFGTHDLFWREHYGVGAIVAVDLAPQFIEDARRRARAAGVADAVDFRAGDALRSGMGDASFTKVVSLDAALHFKTRVRFFAEAFRLLERGGVLVMTDLIPLRLPITLGERLRAWKDAFETEVPIGNQYDAARYEELLRGAGFTDVRVESIRGRTIRPFLRYAAGRLRECAGSAAYSAKSLDAARQFHLGLRVDYERETLDHVLVRAVKP